jgi:hypothetical protein
MPIWHNDVEQGSEAWLKLRAGIPTASEFHKIITPTGKPSAQADGYLNRLIAEAILKRPITGPVTEAMKRGRELEPQAVAAYELQTGLDTTLCGFVTNDEGTAGASLDRLVGEPGALETKCPEPETHVGYMRSRSIENEKKPQVQGQLYISGRQWVDVMSYHPEMDRVIIRVERDEEFIRALHYLLTDFIAKLATAKSQLIQEVALP